MTWLLIVCLGSAAGLAAAGTVVVLGQEPRASEEAGTRRAIVGLGLLTVAVALAAVGGALLGAGGTRSAQIGAFGGAAATVVLPLLAVGLSRRDRRSRRLRRSRING
jgi:hypothetical protein